VLNTPTRELGVYDLEKRCMSATKSMIGTLQKAMRGGDKVVVVYISPNVMTL